MGEHINFYHLLVEMGDGHRQRERMGERERERERESKTKVPNIFNVAEVDLGDLLSSKLLKTV